MYAMGLLSIIIRFDAQELKKVKWYVLHNNPEIDTYRSQFKSLNDLDNATLHIDGQSTEVDAPPDIIDVVDQGDDITDDEDALPHDLADSDDEDLINVDDDGVDKMSADVARSHGGNGGGEDRPPPHHVPTGCMGCFANLGKGKRKPNLGGRAAGKLNTRDKTRNRSLKEITDKKCPVPIRFELRDKQTLMPLGDHAAYWSSYIKEVIKGVPLYYPSWLKVPKERKATLIIGTELTIWRRSMATRPEDITAKEWDKYIQFWNDPKNIARAAQNWQNRAKSMEEMKRLEATGTYTDDEINRLARRGKQRGHILGVGRVLPARATTGPSTPASESTLNSLHKKVNFMMSLFKSGSKYSDMFSQFESGGASGSGGCGDDEESADDQEDEDEDGDGDG
ncbi:hypothetical protein Tco_0686661 [Tanacetum coccineum]